MTDLTPTSAPENDAVVAAPEMASQSDPVVRVLGVVAGIMAIGVVLGGLYAAYFGVVNPPAPRTFEERQLALLSSLSVEQSRSAEVWGDYAEVLIDTRQYSQAAEVIKKGKKQTNNDSSIIALEAKLLHARGQDAEAVKVADKAIATAIAYRTKTIEDLKEKGVNMAEKDIPAPAIITSYLIKAEIAEKKKDWQGAVDAYTKALEDDPGMSDVYLSRGDAYVKLGDKKAAEYDYKQALIFIPGYAEAEARLKKIGASK